MTTLIERDLEFNFPTALNAFQFDDVAFHGFSTMKRVDFIVEYEDYYHFLEIKDPDHPNASNSEAFIRKFSGVELIHELAGKYRDTLLFRILSEKPEKPITYIVVLSMASLEPALLINKQDNLHQCIPITHNEWTQNCAASCIILNLEKYKETFGAHSVRRISDGE